MASESQPIDKGSVAEATTNPEHISPPPGEAPPADPMLAQSEHEEEHFDPRGALAFVIIMVVGYVIYWFITYFEILAHGS